jgi:hypothetical protein
MFLLDFYSIFLYPVFIPCCSPILRRTVMEKLLAVFAVTLFMLAPAAVWANERENYWNRDTYYNRNTKQSERAYRQSESPSSPPAASRSSYRHHAYEQQEEFLPSGMHMKDVDYYTTDDGKIVDPQTLQEYGENDLLPSGKFYFPSGRDNDTVLVP